MATPYYTAAQYADSWGQEELDRVTADETGAADPDAFGEALGKVSSEMNAYLVGRYALPFEPVPDLLEAIAAALVREKLHGTYPTETVTKEADRARKLLEHLSAGKAQLTVDTGEVVDPSGGGMGSAWSAPPRVFDAETLAKF